ncbi:MAG: 30S ribosome-binding factor RbfA [bacterium]
MRRTRRPQRLGGLLQEEVSRLLLREIKDPRIAGVTLTSVKVSPDLRFAMIYFSVMGGPERQREATKGLQSARGMIKRELGRNLELQYVPDIEFLFDDSLEYAEHIDQLLKQIADSKN